MRSREADNLRPLTSLRFVAAMMIVLHHATNYYPWAEFAKHLPLSQGVSFFFVLSGFILTYVYSQRNVSYGRFLWARFARLWPVHLVTCLLVVAFIHPGSQTWPGTGFFSPWVVLASNLTLTQSFVPFMGYVFSWNGVSWSISTEVGFYLAFPVLLIGIERTWHWKLAACAGIIAIYAVILTLADVPFEASGPAELNVTFATYASPFFRAFEFVLGMSVYVGWRKLGGFRWGCAAATGVEVAALLYVVIWYAYLRFLAWPLFQWPPTLVMWFATCGACFMFAAMIAAFAGGQGLFGRALSWGPFVWLGEVSFALYMVHQIIMKWFHIEHLLGRMEPLNPLLALGACLAAAALLHHAVELPARRFLLGGWTRIVRRPQPAMAALAR